MALDPRPTTLPAVLLDEEIEPLYADKVARAALALGLM